MAGHWNTDGDLDAQLDFQLVRHSFVTMFWRRELLDETTDWLSNHGYRVAVADASSWANETEALRGLGAVLGFQVDEQATVDALGDALTEIVSGRSDSDSAPTGLVLVLTGYDELVRRDDALAHVILDTVADCARAAILLGHRLLALVQTDDPQLDFRPIGAMAVMWNADEWLDVRRSRA